MAAIEPLKERKLCFDLFMHGLSCLEIATQRLWLLSSVEETIRLEHRRHMRTVKPVKPQSKVKRSAP